MIPSSQPTEDPRRQAEEFEKAGTRIRAQRGQYGGARPASLAWLLTFLQEDGQTYSFGKLSDRWEEVKRFALDGGLDLDETPLSNQLAVRLSLPGRLASPFTATRPYAGPTEKEALIMLQRAVKVCLDTYVDRGWARSFDLTLSLRVQRDAPRIIVQSAEIMTGFQYQAFHLIGELGPRIRKCRRCQRLFLAGRNDKEFCSGTCQAMKYKAEHPPKAIKKKHKGKRLKKGGKHGTKR